MQYMVMGVDGKEYGPSDMGTLKSWVLEGRITPQTVLRDFGSGQTMPASSLSELFPSSSPAGASPVGMSYPRGGTGYAAPARSDEGGGAFAGVILRSVLGVVLFFVLHGIGLIIAGSSLITAFQLQGNGSKYGIPAIVISSISVVLIGVGWVLRLSH